MIAASASAATTSGYSLSADDDYSPEAYSSEDADYNSTSFDEGEEGSSDSQHPYEDYSDSMDDYEGINEYGGPEFEDILSFVERGRAIHSFKRFRGKACRTSRGQKGRNGRDYHFHRHTSLDACKKKCLDFGVKCTGYEYDSFQRNCEVWKVFIDQSKLEHVRGLDCYIKEKKTVPRNQCFRNSSPRVGGFNFKLEDSHDRKCVDRNRQLYEYGQFRGVSSFDSCARTCVNHVPRSLLRNFQGIDYNCEAKACNCLYDKGTLNKRNSGKFDRTVTRNLNGRGRVRDTRFAKGFACGSASQSNFRVAEE